MDVFDTISSIASMSLEQLLSGVGVLSFLSMNIMMNKMFKYNSF